VIFEFYRKKDSLIENILRARAGPGGPTKFLGPGRAGLS
jgi:hypothetical protein